MKPALKILILSFALWSCGASTKHIQQSTTTDKGVVITTDKSVKETTKEIDTTIHVKGDSAESSITKKEIGESKDSIVKKTVKGKNGIELITEYNKNTGEFKAKAKNKPKDIPIKAKETTKTTNDIKTEDKKDKTVKTKDKQVQKEGTVNWTKVIIWCGVAFFALILIVVLIKLPNFKK